MMLIAVHCHSGLSLVYDVDSDHCHSGLSLVYDVDSGPLSFWCFAFTVLTILDQALRQHVTVLRQVNITLVPCY